MSPGDFQGRHLRDPLFDALARHAATVAQPVFFGLALGAGGRVLRSGSGFFLSIGTRTIGVTCEHVLRAYREGSVASPGLVFQFGPVRIVPDACLIAASRDLDLATFDVTEHLNRPDGITPGICITPRVWPPGDIDSEDILAFAGFPGSGREQLATDYLRFHAFSAGTTVVAALGPTHLQTRIELSDSLIAGDRPSVADDVRGISGGPVFVWRRGSVLVAELVGVVMEYQDTLDLLYVRRASCLSADGGIMREV